MMKNKLLSLLLLACVSASAFVGCNFSGFGSNNNVSNKNEPERISSELVSDNSDTASENDSNETSDSTAETPVEKVDFAAQTKLNMSSPSKKIQLTPDSKTGKITYTHIDGDTTHFGVSRTIDENGTIKSRYLGVDTPESTGDIEVWGKAASRFTKERLSSASVIVLESDADGQWTYDSNNRYLTWVWYKAEGSDDFRLLNLELLQEGLAVESRTADSRYDDVCTKAAMQARNLGLYIYSNEKDPDFYYGSAIKTTLKEVRSDLESFKGKRVAVHGIVSMYAGKGSIYVQEYNEEDNRAYGLPVFYGYNNVSYDPILAPGNEVRIVGEVTYSDTFGWQISGLHYDFMDPDNEESIKMFDKNLPIDFPEITVADFIANDYALAKELLYGTVSVKNLYVADVYTTKDGDSKGAMTLTCKDENGTEIKIRTSVLRGADGNVITADYYEGKTINVKGIAEEYTYTDYDTNLPVTTYQIDVFASTYITFTNNN